MLAAAALVLAGLSGSAAQARVAGADTVTSAADLAHRRQQLVELRRAGATDAEIAAKLGMTRVSSAEPGGAAGSRSPRPPGRPAAAAGV